MTSAASQPRKGAGPRAAVTVRPNRSTWMAAQPALANSGISMLNALPSVSNRQCRNPSAERLTRKINSVSSAWGSKGAGEVKAPRANLVRAFVHHGALELTEPAGTLASQLLEALPQMDLLARDDRVRLGSEFCRAVHGGVGLSLPMRGPPRVDIRGRSMPESFDGRTPRSKCPRAHPRR